jgi:3-methyladenine DNA glycosylase/8-oxoguanine DNA glycosylase
VLHLESITGGYLVCANPAHDRHVPKAIMHLRHSRPQPPPSPMELPKHARRTASFRTLACTLHQ